MDQEILPTLAQLRAWVAAQPLEWHAQPMYDNCPLAQYLTATQGKPWGVEDGRAWPLVAGGGAEVDLSPALDDLVSEVDEFDPKYYTEDEDHEDWGIIKRDEILAIIDTLLRQEVPPCG